jgi:hypothetical protein
VTIADPALTERIAAQDFDTTVGDGIDVMPPSAVPALAEIDLHEHLGVRLGDEAGGLGDEAGAVVIPAPGSVVLLAPQAPTTDRRRGWAQRLGELVGDRHVGHSSHFTQELVQLPFVGLDRTLEQLEGKGNPPRLRSHSSKLSPRRRRVSGPGFSMRPE